MEAGHVGQASISLHQPRLVSPKAVAKDKIVIALHQPDRKPLWTSQVISFGADWS
jgi:hypothetical protein